MTVVILVPLLCTIVGLLLYALSANARVSEAGRLLYFAGVFVTLLALQGHAVRLP
jgi:hypothetical protein